MPRRGTTTGSNTGDFVCEVVSHTLFTNQPHGIDDGYVTDSFASSVHDFVCPAPSDPVLLELGFDCDSMSGFVVLTRGWTHWAVQAPSPGWVPHLACRTSSLTSTTSSGPTPGSLISDFEATCPYAERPQVPTQTDVMWEVDISHNST